MTKTEEIARFASLISAFPADSYIRPWLMSIREQVEADIRGDIFPSVTPAETRAAIAAESQRATERAAEIIATAEQKAARIVKDAESQAQTVRDRLTYEKRRVLSAIAECERQLS